jgi:hypothetical protein
VVEQVRFDQAFTFQYSPRPGTPAAERTDEFVDPEIVKDRYGRLERLVRQHSREAHQRLVGTDQELLVESPSKTDPGRWSGRTRGNHLVHLIAPAAPEGTPPPFAPDLALDAVQEFTQGTVAMHASGSWDLSVTERAIDPAVAGEDVLVLPLPRASDAGASTGTVLGGSSLFVPTGAANRELAFELMLALTADDVALALAFEEGRLPAAAALYDDPRFAEDPRLAAFVEQLGDADVMPLIAYPELDVAFGEALEAVLKLQEDAATALGAVQRRAETLQEP